MKELRKNDLKKGEEEVRENGLIFHRVPTIGKMCFTPNTLDIYQFGTTLGKRRQSMKNSEETFMRECLDIKRFKKVLTERRMQIE